MTDEEWEDCLTKIAPGNRFVKRAHAAHIREIVMPPESPVAGDRIKCPDCSEEHCLLNDIIVGALSVWCRGARKTVVKNGVMIMKNAKFVTDEPSDEIALALTEQEWYDFFLELIDGRRPADGHGHKLLMKLRHQFEEKTDE